MMPLVYLAGLCSCIDTTYHVSLEYGANIGDVPRWCIRIAIPLKAIFLTRPLQRGDDIQATISAAQSLGVDLHCFIETTKEHPIEHISLEQISLDIANLT